mgnify:CR=1 FL=1
MLMYRQLLQPKTVAEAYEMALKFKQLHFWPAVVGSA